MDVNPAGWVRFRLPPTLGTVHGSKGAEHDHVLLLDGGWQLRGRDSWEQLRRLYYVGMTRARQTLTLVQCEQDGAPWIPNLRGEAIHRSRFAVDASMEKVPRLQYELLRQADISLSYAGRAANHEEITRSVNSLATGDALTLVPTEHGVFLQAADGVRVGALSKDAAPRWHELLPQVQCVRVAANLIRRRSDEGADYQERLRRDAW